MNRKEELHKLLDDMNSNDKTAMTLLIDKMIFLENQLESLEKLPFIKTHPQNSNIQKTTPAAKLYKELLQQYTNVIKVISRVFGDADERTESPLRRWVNERNANSKQNNMDS